MGQIKRQFLFSTISLRKPVNVQLSKVITGGTISVRVLIKDAFVFCHILYIRVARRYKRYNYLNREHCKHYSWHKIIFLESVSVRTLEGSNGAFAKIR